MVLSILKKNYNARFRTRALVPHTYAAQRTAKCAASNSEWGHNRPDLRA